MCLAIPSKIVSLNGALAVVELFGGGKVEVSTLLLPEGPSIGDYVIVHAGFAIQKIERENAELSHRFLEELLKKDA